IGDSSLERHNAIRSNAEVVMHAHAAARKDHVEIGLSIIQLKICLTVLALVGHGAILDFRYGSFGRVLNLPYRVEQLLRCLGRRHGPIGHDVLAGMADSAALDPGRYTYWDGGVGNIDGAVTNIRLCPLGFRGGRFLILLWRIRPHCPWPRYGYACR